MKALVTALLLLTGANPSYAHQADTSYTRIHLGTDRLAVEATFDLHVLARIVPVDRDGDEIVTRTELEAAAPGVRAYLRERVLVSLDDGPPDLGSATGETWPEQNEIRVGDWPQTLVDFRFERPLQRHPDILTVTYATWPELGPSHTNLTRIAQAGYDDLEIVFTEAEPDYDYFTEAPRSGWDHLVRFVHLGMEHIWGGLDHVLFLVALLVVSRLRELLQIVTAFTAAHSITLALAVLEFVELPPRVVEASIAATIVWVAWENLRGRGGAHRWRLTFAFGLVHGFGFAGVLRELELPAEGILRSLAGFNLGVELGQIAVVAALFPLVALVTRTRLGRPAVAGVSAAVGVAGVAWLVERTFGFSWMPL